MDWIGTATVIAAFGGVGAALWTTNKTAGDTRKAQDLDRKALSYLEVLRLVEHEAHWHEAESANFKIRAEDPEMWQYYEKVESPDVPAVTERSLINAHLAAFGTGDVRGLYKEWRKAIVVIQKEKENLRWDWNMNRDGDEPMTLHELDPLLNSLAPSREGRPRCAWRGSREGAGTPVAALTTTHRRGLRRTNLRFLTRTDASIRLGTRSPCRRRPPRGVPPGRIGWHLRLAGSPCGPVVDQARRRRPQVWIKPQVKGLLGV